MLQECLAICVVDCTLGLARLKLHTSIVRAIEFLFVEDLVLEAALGQEHRHRVRHVALLHQVCAQTYRNFKVQLVPRLSRQILHGAG